MKLETNVINKADAIITTAGDRYHKILKDKITNPEKIHQIYNGYDKLNFDKIEEIKPNKFNIVFTGMLTQSHNYETFNKVLKTLNPKQNNLNLIFTLAGRIDKKIIEIYSNKIDIT